MRLERTVVVGHWTDSEVDERIGRTRRPAPGRTGRARASPGCDNMRDVAVTDGDKVEAERGLGFSVNTYGVGDWRPSSTRRPTREVDALCRDLNLDEQRRRAVAVPGPSGTDRRGTGRASRSASALLGDGGSPCS